MNPYNGFSPAQRNRALRWLNGEYAAGRRTRPTSCQACGQTEGLVEAHSEDYSGPPFGDNIGQFGLCYRCHLIVHSRFSAPRHFELYATIIDHGLVWPAIPVRNYYAIQTMLRSPLEALAAIAGDVCRPRSPEVPVIPLLLWRMADGEFRP